MVVDLSSTGKTAPEFASDFSVKTKMGEATLEMLQALGLTELQQANVNPAKLEVKQSNLFMLQTNKTNMSANKTNMSAKVNQVSSSRPQKNRQS